MYICMYIYIYIHIYVGDDGKEARMPWRAEAEVL